jgi:hypothetical protein
VTIDHEGQITLFGNLSSGVSFGGSSALVFTTDITHSFGSDETIIGPGVSGQFSFGSDQSLRLGTGLSFSTEHGLTDLTGFLEYRYDEVRLRIEGSMTGLQEQRGITPGGNMLFQGTLTIPFE